MKWLPLLTWLTLLRGTRGTTVPKIHPFCCGHPSLTETLFKKNINLSSTEPLYPHHLHSRHHFAFHGRVHPKSVKIAGSSNFRMDLPGSLVVAQSPNKCSCLLLAIRWKLTEKRLMTIPTCKKPWQSSLQRTQLNVFHAQQISYRSLQSFRPLFWSSSYSGRLQSSWLFGTLAHHILRGKSFPK